LSEVHAFAGRHQDGAAVIDDARSLRPFPLHALALAGVAAALAATVPLDRMFALLPGPAPVRGASMLALALSGLFLAGKAGLRTAPYGLKRPVVAAVAIALALAVGLVVVDTTAPRSILLPDYLDALRATPQLVRLQYYGVRAFGEDVAYRLFLMSFLAFAGASLLRRDRGSIPARLYWAAIVASSIIDVGLNCWPYVSLTPAIWSYTLVRLVLPGVLWGYLYWRHGFVTATAAHLATHMFYQPLMTLALG
jgi:Type II CAAX prenyl endopeptidase Rce1-like